MTANAPQYRTIETKVPARLDRLPWSNFHWRVVIGLGTVWILDGLEVTIVGAIGSRLTNPSAGVGLSASDVGIAGALYVAGACLGALFFGQLTDRFGRKRLMMITLATYLVSTVATAFAFAPWYFMAARFFTGSGIGGEYSAINSAIDELIPARRRGQTDITINGSYWVGSIIGSLGSLLLLDQALLAVNIGWRVAFAIGAILAIGIFLVRNSLPESPRWLFIHGREDEAERIVGEIEQEIRQEKQTALPEPSASITVHQRESISLAEIARVAIHDYPGRTVLGLALFVGQAFLYNAVVFDLGTMVSKYFGVSSGLVPAYFLVYAASNFLGAFLLARLFDTVGRVKMISFTYLLSSAIIVAMGLVWANVGLSAIEFEAFLVASFFFASAGVSGAYLTVSEVFPMETRALAIAFFSAVGTAAGGIVGPLLFGYLIGTGNVGLVVEGFYLGAGIMALGGIAELVFGVAAEQRSLESIARPLTAVRERAGEARERAGGAVSERIRRRHEETGDQVGGEDGTDDEEGGAAGSE